MELSFFFKFFAVGFTFIQDFRLDIKYLFAIACSSSPVIQKTNKQVIKCVLFKDLKRLIIKKAKRN